MHQAFLKDVFWKTVSLTTQFWNSIEFQNCTLKNCLLINSDLSESDFTETIFDECQFQQLEKGSLSQVYFESCHFIKTIFNGISAAQIGSACLMDSKFSNSKKSIEFKGDFYLGFILHPVNGIIEMLFK